MPMFHFLFEESEDVEVNVDVSSDGGMIVLTLSDMEDALLVSLGGSVLDKILEGLESVEEDPDDYDTAREEQEGDEDEDEGGKSQRFRR